MSAVSVVEVSKTFGKTPVLDRVSLEVGNGAITAVVGSSGCGKTTLLRIIAGFETPNTGTVSIGDKNVVAVPPHRRNVGYVAQDGALFPHLTVGQNIAYGLSGTKRSSHAAQIAELLELVALDSSFADRRPHQLSGGQQQRVALARALARRPAVLLLDEPFSALDAGLRVATRKSVAGTLREAGVTSILVTHDQEEALSFADQVAVMRAGAFTQVGTPESVYSAPADLFTAEFLGDCVLLDATVTAGIAECILGRIPVAGSVSAGEATLMLRPEQLDTRRVVDGEPAAGVVVAAEFLGSDVISTIALTGVDRQITVRSNSICATPVGSHIAIEIVGKGMCYPR